MSDFRQLFLTDSIDNLKLLQRALAAGCTENLRRELFRAVHTVKGGAQTFGLENPARAAERLENLLSDHPASTDRTLLPQGIEILINSLLENDAALPADMPAALPDAGRKNARSAVLLTDIPPAVFRNFSGQERAATLNALRQAKHIYCAEAGFEIASFAGEYRKLRKILGDKSDILASLPSERHNAAGKIGFRIFLASRRSAEEIRAAAGDFAVEIFSYTGAANDSNALSGMLSQIAAHGEKAANQLGKQIEITILSSNARLSARETKAFFDILLHLVRNAVDHAVERTGVIEIILFREAEGFYLSVADDGRGVDVRKLRERAIAKNLISDDDFLNEADQLALVFAPGLSTAARVTEISGRGVGLDAVKTAVEKLNGKISVRTRKTNGTIFEIFVPIEKL